jgi:branched-chain amino acid transport system permease protein
VTDFLQLLVAGASLGAIYALICLGFVVIYRATGVLNFAQGGFVVLGAYLTHQFAAVFQLPFVLAVVIAMAVVAGLGIVLERLVLRRMVGQPVFAVILITLGLLFILEQACVAIWGHDLLPIGDPWGVRTIAFRGLTLRMADLWTIGAAAAVLGSFFLLFRRSTVGVAMRAAAADPEAALAQGISSRVIYGLSWAVAGAVAVLAGVLLGAGPEGVDLTLGAVAFRAFPAMVLGGLDSAEGAVAGGLVIGLTEVLTAGYLTPALPWLGDNFHVVMPYLLMILIMLIRPYGLFGTEEVRRA